MVGDSSYEPEDAEHSELAEFADFADLAAPDFSFPGDQSDADSGGFEPAAESAAMLFAVTNPPDTVTVTTFMDGRVQQIDLSPKVTEMTETALAEEIMIIAGLATQEARAAQYAYMLDSMREQGHDDVATRDFLTRDLELPTPESVDAARAQVFSTRYSVDDD